MGQNLGIRLALKDVAASDKFLAQLCKVLDNAVVHNGDAPVAAGVRMRVLLCRTAVRSPASVADAAGSTTRDGGSRLIDLARSYQGLPQHGNLANAAHHLKTGPVRPLKRDACGVVPTILQFRQPVHQDGGGAVRSGVTHNSAHSTLSNRRQRIGPHPTCSSPACLSSGSRALLSMPATNCRERRALDYFHLVTHIKYQ